MRHLSFITHHSSSLTQDLSSIIEQQSASIRHVSSSAMKDQRRLQEWYASSHASVAFLVLAQEVSLLHTAIIRIARESVCRKTQTFGVSLCAIMGRTAASAVMASVSTPTVFPNYCLRWRVAPCIQGYGLTAATVSSGSRCGSPSSSGSRCITATHRTTRGPYGPSA